MRKIIFLLVATFMLATAVPTPTLAGDYHTLELREKFSISFDVCGGMFGLLFGYRNYSGCREFGFYDSDGEWYCLWMDGYSI